MLHVGSESENVSVQPTVQKRKGSWRLKSGVVRKDTGSEKKKIIIVAVKEAELTVVVGVVAVIQCLLP